jgi:tetratricopeptide (TPR) repeat protein
MKTFNRFFPFLCLGILLFGWLPPEVNASFSIRSRPTREKKRDQSRKGSKVLFEKIQEAYLMASYEEVVRLGDQYLDRYKGVRNADQVFHTVALAHLELKSYSKARQRLFSLRSLFPRSPMGDQVGISLGQSFFLEGRVDEAVQVWQNSLAAFPESQYRVIYLERLAHGFEKQGRFDEARAYLERIATDYPKGFYAREAQERLERGDLFFTVQVGSFSDKKNAQILVNELKDFGMASHLSISKSGLRTFHRVRIGQYDTKREAEQVASRLRKKGYLTKIYP